MILLLEVHRVLEPSIVVWQMLFPYSCKIPMFILLRNRKTIKGNAYNGFEDVQNRLQNIEAELPSDYKELIDPTDFLQYG